jgi:hypothetical protein
MPQTTTASVFDNNAGAANAPLLNFFKKTIRKVAEKLPIDHKKPRPGSNPVADNNAANDRAERR